MGVNSL